MGKIIPLGGVIMMKYVHYCVGSGGHNRGDKVMVRRVLFYKHFRDRITYSDI